MSRFAAFIAVWIGAFAAVLSPALQGLPGGVGSTPSPAILEALLPLAPLEGDLLVFAADTAELQRVPVLLVPGWSDHADDIEPLRERFIEEGWGPGEVEIAEFDDRFGSNASHAREIATAVRLLQHRTGAPRVDVVAHSMGGLAVRYFLLFEGGSSVVRRAAFLGTPHFGTVAAILAWGEGGREMVPGSRFLERLNQTDPIPGEVEALALRTVLDLRVIPASSAILPGAENLEVCCPTHQGMIDDARTFQEVLTFLRNDVDPVAEEPEGGFQLGDSLR